MLPDRFRLFRSNRDANVAVITALVSVPLLAFTGAAIDYGQTLWIQTKLRAATDATSLALCQTPAITTVAQLQLQAGIGVTGYMGSTGLTVDPLTVTYNPRQITLSTHFAVKTFFGGITGISTMNPVAKATCATPVPKTFEIALVLDTTGSMSSSGGTSTKLQAAQQAASNFIDYVHANAAFSAATRISIVPFAASVAVNPTTYRYATWIDQLGKSSYHWQNVSGASAAGFTSRFDIFDKLKLAYSNWGWAGCLETLPYPQNVQDVKPTSSPDTLYVPMFAPDEPGEASTTYSSYSDSKSPFPYYSYNSYIDDYTTSGSCAKDTSRLFAAAENRACKYLFPKDISPANPNSFVGIPNGPNFGCTSQPLQRLTTDVPTLKNLVNSLTALGATNIHEGLMWGWRTLSPNSVFADGSSYTATDVNKIIILMTDGANSWTDNANNNYNNTLYFSMGYLLNADGSKPNGRLPSSYQNISASQTRNALDELTSQACTNAKAKAISIFTIGFSTSSDPIDSQGLTLLRGCATSADQAFVANTSDSLIAAFNKIATSIGTLRLTK